MDLVLVTIYYSCFINYDIYEIPQVVEIIVHVIVKVLFIVVVFITLFVLKRIRYYLESHIFMIRAIIPN